MDLLHRRQPEGGHTFLCKPHWNRNQMKKEIHPDYHDAKIECGGCGSTFTVGSTLPEIHIGVCSECHPFYTGKARNLDSEGRVDRFNKKYANFQGAAKK